MRKYLTILLPLAVACSAPQHEVTVVNNSDQPMVNKVVEYDADSILQLLGTPYFVVMDSVGKEIPSQFTHDGLMLFQADVPAHGSARYFVEGCDTMPIYNNVTCGRVYTERDDDMAWENDMVGFRVYGPALMKRGERGYGYDVFFKHSPSAPVLEELYARELSKDNFRSYHEDYGLGMDCYAVGPTLGAGVTAIIGEDGKLIYPWTYDTATILDNGPLRFTVQLDFPPVAIGSDSAVVERRLITLDAGDHLNSTIVYYDGLTQPVDVAAGIVLRDEAGRTDVPVSRKFIAYADPTQGDHNGKGLMGIVFSQVPDSIYVTDREEVEHLIGVTRYNPGDKYAYKWGFAWDRADIKDMNSWTDYLSRQ